MTQSPEFWVNLIVIICLGGASAVGGLLFFVLRGIRDNQTRIWDWAAGEVNSLHAEVKSASDDYTAEALDTRRWVRHALRDMYGELLELARVVGGKDADDVAKSITNRLSQGDL